MSENCAGDEGGYSVVVCRDEVTRSNPKRIAFRCTYWGIAHGLRSEAVCTMHS